MVSRVWDQRSRRIDIVLKKKLKEASAGDRPGGEAGKEAEYRSNDVSFPPPEAAAQDHLGTLATAGHLSVWRHCGRRYGGGACPACRSGADCLCALVSKFRYASLVVTPLGFALSVFLTNRFFPNAQGSGIPQAIAARHLTDQSARESLVSLRFAAGKIILTLFGLLCGASVGREGPTVQIGASIMFALGRFSPRRQPGLILAGAAAGVAAAFNTPLAGIVFGIEEMSRAFETRTSSLIIGAVIAAGLTSLALIGNYAYFGTSAMACATASTGSPIPLCGVVGGLAGGLFSRILYRHGARIFQSGGTRDQALPARLCRGLWTCGRDLRPCVRRHDLRHRILAGEGCARKRITVAAEISAS